MSSLSFLSSFFSSFLSSLAALSADLDSAGLSAAGLSASLPALELLLVELLLPALESPLALDAPLAAEVPDAPDAGLVLAVLPGLAAPAEPEAAKLLDVPKLLLGEPRLLEVVLEAPRLAVACVTARVGVGAPPKVPSVPPMV